MGTTHAHRYCDRCGSRLARDNTGTRCAACVRIDGDGVLRPPVLPAEFWDADLMRDALATWHMGRVFHAYRTHPHHGQPLSQERIGSWLGLTQGQVSRIEKGRAPEELTKLIRYAQILGIPRQSLWFALPGSLDTATTDAQAPPAALTAEGHVPTVAPDASSLADLFGLAGADDEDAMQRRAFLMSLASVAGLGAAEPGLGLEGMRHGLHRAITGRHAAIDVDEWQEIALEYGHTYYITAPRDLLKTLAVDLYGLQVAIERHPDDQAQRGLRQAGAMLCVFVAQTMGNLGYPRQAGRWWRTARRAADESGDRHTILWARGREIVRAGYEQRPVTSVFALIDEAEARIDNATPSSTALAEFLGGKAQTLALMGGQASADTGATLARLRRAFDALPYPITAAHDSVFTWGEENLRCCESLAYTYLGDFKQASAAQDRALALYPADYLRGPAQIELQRALCLVGAGDVTTGVRHAQTVITSLPVVDRIRPVADLGRKVLRAVPVTAHNQEDVVTYRECLTASFAAPAPKLTARKESAPPS